MLYLSAIILSFFLSFLLLTKNNKSQADYILLAWLIVTGFHLLTFYLFSTDQFNSFPLLVALGFPLPLAQGPFLYLYTRQQTTSTHFRKILLLHFLPVFLSYLMFMKFYLMTSSQQAEIFNQKGKGYELQMMINVYAIYLSGIIYVTLSLMRLLRYRKNIVNQFSNTEKINFNWLLYLIIWIALIWIVILFVQEDKLIFGAAALFVIWLGYFGIKQVQVFSQHTNRYSVTDYKKSNEKNQEAISAQTINAADDFTDEINTDDTKYQKSSLNEELSSAIHERLKKMMTEEKVYKNPDLTLNDLANSLDVHPNHLSQVINSKEKRNFYDLINEKRVEEFCDQVKKGINKQYTLLAIAFECGFNSKASFNRNFKKYTGLSPSDYLKKFSQG